MSTGKDTSAPRKASDCSTNPSTIKSSRQNSASSGILTKDSGPLGNGDVLSMQDSPSNTIDGIFATNANVNRTALEGRAKGTSWRWTVSRIWGSRLNRLCAGDYVWERLERRFAGDKTVINGLQSTSEAEMKIEQIAESDQNMN